MNITMSMILAYLSRTYKCYKGAFYNADYQIERAKLVSNETAVFDIPKTCFVVAGDCRYWAPGILSESIICSSQGRAVDAPCAIVVEDASCLAALRNAVANAITRYDNWANNLLDLAMHGAGLEEIVDCAHELFKNPISIIDENYRVLAQTTDDAMDDVLWATEFEQSSLGRVWRGKAANEEDEEVFLGYLDELRQSGHLRNYETITGQYVSTCLAKNSGDSLICVSVVDKNAPVSDADYECLKFLSSIVGAKIKAMEYTWQDSSGSYVALLQDVVRGNLSDASEFKARLSGCWITVDDNFTVVTIAAKRGFLRYFQLCRIEDDLSRIVPDGKGVISSRTYVLFVNHNGVLSEEILAALEGYVEANDLVAGISESRGEDYPLHELLKQAKLALRIRRRAFPEKALVKYVDCRKYYLYEICSQQEDWECYMHPCLDILERHDRENASTLESTLRCLVKHRGNRTETARELNIQRNTLQYRLGKIEELAFVDLSCADVFDHIAFSLNLKNYCNVAE